MNEFNMKVLIMLSPLLVIQFGLALFCAVKIFKEGVANLNKWIWLGIVLLGNIAGSIVFLVIGRRREQY